MKKDKSVVFFGIFLALSILSVIYCIINEINIIGAGICVLAATYLFLDSMREEKAKYEERIAGILSGRLEEIEKVEKALYVQVKKNAEFTRENLESIKEDSRRGFTDIIENQNKAVKVIVKYNRDDIKKAAALNKTSGEKIVTVLNQNFEKLIREGNKKDSGFKEITGCLDSNTEKVLVRMESRMKDIEKEVVKLQQISDSLRVDVKSMNVSVPQYIPMPSMPMMHTEPVSGVIPPVQTPPEHISPEPEPMPVTSQEISAESLKTEEVLGNNVLDDIAPARENNVSEEDLMDTLLSNIGSESMGEVTKPDLETALGAVPEESGENNEELSDDILGGLLEDLLEEPEPVSVPEPVKEKEPAVSMPADPNTQLSPEQIAAMFSAVDSEPEEPPAAKETAPPPPAAPADSNKQLSADEIAALFASIG